MPWAWTLLTLVPMTRTLGLMLAFGLLTACGVGDDPPPGGNDDVDERILCTAELTLAGTFTTPVALDPTMGCQPSGTWNVTATVTTMGSCSAVPVKSSYVYNVAGMGHGSTISYMGSGDETQLQISASGDGDCTAFFEHISPAGGGQFHHFEFHPILPEPTTATMTATLEGTATYNLWSEHP